MAYWAKPRRRQPGAPVIVNRQPHTAAVTAIPVSWNHTAPRTRQQWQGRAEWFSTELGLVRFANGLLAQAAARCTLHVEKLVDPITQLWEPIDERLDAVPAKVLNEYQGPYAETPGQLVGQHVYAYKTTGECYMTVEARPEGGLDWSIRSVRAIQFRTNDVLVMDLPGGSLSDGTAHVLPKDQVRRMWVPDPTWPLLATSHMRGVIADCERYWSLARRIRREADSALTNGLLFTPEYAHKYPPAPPGQPASEQELSQLDRDYYRIAEMSFHDDDSVAAIAPMAVHYGNEDRREQPMAPQFINPGRTLDPSTIKLREEAAENIARGLDLPTQLALSGQGGLKPGTGGHYSAWLMSEDFVKSSVAPDLERVAWNDITAAFYRPTLHQLARQGLWNGNPDLYRVGFDTTPITVHPDRGATAITMYGLGLLASLPVLEANGFDASDQPSPDELAQILESLRAVHGRQPEAIQLQTGPVSSPATQGITSPGGIGPSTVKELPPGSPTMAALSLALSPYPSEIDAWLEDPVPA